MHFSSPFHGTTRALLACLLSSAVFCAGAWAQTAQKHFPVDIGAMSVEDGLKRLQRETGINLVFSPDQVRDRATRGVTGDLTIEEAIRRLLDGTGLEVINNNNALYVIVEPEARAPETLQRVKAKPKRPPSPGTSQGIVLSGLEEIVVAGTRVARDGYSAPTPVTVVGAEQIQHQAMGNITDFINTLPALAGSQTPNQNIQTASGVVGTNALSLRDLGIQRTLVLIDGERSVGGTITGAADVNTFPQQLVSRVEVVTGGASAAYGSDALAGVVNFVLDKTYTGLKGEVSGGVTSYGDNRNFKITLTAGQPFASGSGHVLLSAEAEHSDGVVHPSNRRWNASNIGIISNPQYTAANGQPQFLILDPINNSRAAPGGLITSGPLKGVAFGPGGAPYQFDYGSLNDGANMYGSGQASALNVHATQSLGTRESRQNAFARVSYDITDTVNVFAQFGWGHANSYSVALLPLYSGNLMVAADNAFIPATVAAQIAALKLTSFGFGTFNGDLGGLSPEVVGDRTTNRNAIGAHGTLDALDSSWTWDAYFQNGVTRQTSKLKRDINNANFARAIDAVRAPSDAIVCRSTLVYPANGCTPYNLFGLGVNGDAAINYITGTDRRTERFEQNVVAVSLRGEPWSDWAGPVSLATGVEHRSESVRGDAAPTGWFLGNYVPTFGGYNVTEGFVETVVPLAKEVVWAKAMDLSAALRATHYSTAGYVTTWKAGLTYAPVEDIRLRATRSRDIRAPNLQELYSGGVSGTNNVVDPFTNDPTAFIRTLTRGNLMLTPEKADTTGLGLVARPAFIPGFSASVDYWNINIKDAIGSLTGQDIINYCFQGNQTYCQAVTRSAEQITVNIYPFNLAQQIVRGIDYEGSYRVELDSVADDWRGALTFRLLATHYLKNYLNNTVNVPVDIVGQNEGSSADGGLPRWRWRGSLSYDGDPVSFALSARGVSAGTIGNAFMQCTSGCPVSTLYHPTINDNHIDGATYFDASVEYTFMSGVEAFLNIQNVMNADPARVPRINGTPYGYAQTNPVLYDVLGRVFRAGVRFRI
ncbi:MAG: TonB-dependent receptor domain-containing protein [Rhodospirillaceae bacterium]